MKLLLNDNKQLKAVIAALESDDLTDLEDLEHLQTIVWGIKELFYDIYINGEKALKDRLAKANQCQLNQANEIVQEPGCHLSENELNALLNEFPMTLFCVAQKQWFPKLNAEMEKHYALQGKSNSGSQKKSSVCVAIASATKDDMTEQGGWELDYFTLGYRPESHNESFFKAWLDTTRKHQGETIRKEIFELLTSEDTAGKCSKCHSIDSHEEDNYLIHWATPKKNKGFIRFKHTGHLSGDSKDSDCLTCHQGNKNADYSASYEEYNPMKFESNFLTTDKKTCETCHQEEMTQNQCQTCHNYHVSGSLSHPLD